MEVLFLNQILKKFKKSTILIQEITFFIKRYIKF